MTPDVKQRVEALRGSRASDVLKEYLEHKLSTHKRTLVSCPLDQVQRIQGRAQELQDLINYFSRKE